MQMGWKEWERWGMLVKRTKHPEMFAFILSFNEAVVKTEISEPHLGEARWELRWVAGTYLCWIWVALFNSGTLEVKTRTMMKLKNIPNSLDSCPIYRKFEVNWLHLFTIICLFSVTIVVLWCFADTAAQAGQGEEWLIPVVEQSFLCYSITGTSACPCVCVYVCLCL